MEHEEEFEISPLDQTALGLHEIFLSYRRAGFTEDQALKLVVYFMKENAPKEDEEI